MAKRKEAENEQEYQEWLKESNLEDTKENREWFNTPEGKEYEFIQKHKKWWNDL